MRIAIVEDTASIREMLYECLTDEGYEAICLENGREALAWLAAEQTLPDVILLDAIMPVMNGWEFLAARAQQAHLAAIPVVMLSGVDDLRLPEAETRVRVVGKPIALEQLLAIIAEYCVHPPAQERCIG